MQPRLRRHLAEEQRPCQPHGVRQRQQRRQRLEGGGQLLDRKEHAREQGHRRDEQGEVVHEEIEAGRQRRHDQADGGKGEARQEHQRQHPQRQRRGDQAEYGRHRQDRRAGERRLARRPHQLAQQQVVERHRRVEDGLPGLLHLHAREGRVERLEGGAVHGREASRAGGEEGEVGHAGDFRQQRADAVAQAQHVDHRIGQVAEDRRNRQLAPDQEVALPHRNEAQAERGRAEVIHG